MLQFELSFLSEMPFLELGMLKNNNFFKIEKYMNVRTRNKIDQKTI